jgi:hypothetical protein
MIVYLYFNIKFLKEMSKSLLYGKTERKLPPPNSSVFASGKRKCREMRIMQGYQNDPLNSSNIKYEFRIGYGSTHL